MLFQNRYRAPSHRKEGADYAGPGRYFVTICTQNRVPWFGEIRNGMMGLSDIGCLVHAYWEHLSYLRPNIQLGAWIIMPDHLHGIIYIQNDSVEIDHGSISRAGKEMDPWSISTRSISTETRADVAMCIPLFRRRPGELGSIIAQFKAACTKRIWEMGVPAFQWQRNYHDRIIRNDPEYQTVIQYIVNNPRASLREEENLSIILHGDRPMVLQGDRPAVDLYRS